MDSLLCTEEWLNKSPTVDQHKDHKFQRDELFSGQNSCIKITTTMEDREEAFRTFLGKEVSYMPEPGYNNFNHVASGRFKAICWIIRCQWRLNLSPETVFCAANYLDRFISMKLCQNWRPWVFELLAVACLSVASKYNETIAPSFRDILQMEDLEYYFESSLVQRMELTLVKSLQWRLGPITPYSYVELLSNSAIHSVPDEFTAIVTKLLLNVLLDDKFMECRPSVVAMSAIEYISKEVQLSSTDKAFLNSFTSLIPTCINEDDVSKCCKMMDEYDLGSINFSCPSSPVTVLETHQFQHYHGDFQLSLLKKRKKIIGGKKKRSDQEHYESRII